MSRIKVVVAFVVIGVLILLASCPSRENVRPATKARPKPEISVPPMTAPSVERESLGEVEQLNTTARVGDLIVTTKRWAVESARVYPYHELENGDWIDLITVRIDEKTVFQYLCVAGATECRKVFKMRKLLPGEETAPLRKND
ncbi:MAG: hypothetical protein A3D65_02990 [Candidatus Lloydbacteria bacterium RIFCSPHIGHO2_02_FULL_50_13]|uniref:Uncharacterized protein n=1 Tax=Candidatus Lloydbacteria bacterium RIFCSPHIGHO2_02_FULL_50_13 TaxID=1798661 RepID=A0A1G2D2R6_9BACT|nr:MAG: hypothetical protein A3D65_02990 [Candidatus Lloydbacteria bacterium RIFCSPHIGHO2_02_FULL_50_13]